MFRFVLVSAFVAFSSCASLNVGWARITWHDGKVVPTAHCTARVNAEGDVLMECRAMNKYETDLLWQKERRAVESQQM